MDGHGVLGLIAPRFAAVAHAWNDKEGDSVFADESEWNNHLLTAVYSCLYRVG